jgi:hypothetical protein
VVKEVGVSAELELLLGERAIHRILYGAGSFVDTYVRGVRSPDDVVQHILDE